VSMTVVVTRDVEDRYRGFLTSCMLEVSSGCYVAPGMSAGVRERVWAVVAGWHASLRTGSVLMLWPQRDRPGGLDLRLLGEPPKDIVDLDDVLTVRWSISELCSAVV
jgi:CRISPR-associated protein Cas2